MEENENKENKILPEESHEEPQDENPLKTGESDHQQENGSGNQVPLDSESPDEAFIMMGRQKIKGPQQGYFRAFEEKNGAGSPPPREFTPSYDSPTKGQEYVKGPQQGYFRAFEDRNGAGSPPPREFTPS
ncbi:MAG: hypothetical protein LUC17_04430, partial [Oscillospiraceae bacterium]|nr:hypothetical protein [Oscillospiraceae bacterium]